MKIAISGVHGVGKTTLINALQQTNKYNHIQFITNQIRNLQGKVIINEGANDATQLAALEVVSKTALIKESIDDRCILDVTAYTLALYRRKQVNEKTVFKAIGNFNKYINNYNALFYLPPEIPFEKDGVRSEDMEWRDDVTSIFEGLIECSPVPVYTITGTVLERVLQVNSIIDKL